LIVEAAKARALVWQLMHEAVQAQPPQARTPAGLSAAVTREAARILGMDEDELVRLLRNHPPH
jgi:hypothetical protein